ncbi:calcineurin-like phosphoesterase C-terminal domain-containing protein, partial [Klebsiella pneumoniae]
LLKDFRNVLVLSGHSHTQQHVYHGKADGWNGDKPLHEYNVGANCGAFWSGVKNAAGVPDSIMSDGTPKGYALLDVAGNGSYRLQYRVAGKPASEQIGLHAPKVLRQGAYPAWGIYANVYMGEDASVVEYRVDGGAWQPMKQVSQPDPRLMVENVADDLADSLRGYDRSPE